MTSVSGLGGNSIQAILSFHAHEALRMLKVHVWMCSISPGFQCHRSLSVVHLRWQLLEAPGPPACTEDYLSWGPGST